MKPSHKVGLRVAISQESAIEEPDVISTDKKPGISFREKNYFFFLVDLHCLMDA